MICAHDLSLHKRLFQGQNVNSRLSFILTYNSLQATPKSRPTGVTIIAILNIIGGITMLLGGITLVAAGTIIPSLPPSAFQNGNLTEPNVNVSGIPLSFLGGTAIAIGSVLIAIGIVSFIVAYGLLKGMRWAWTVTVVLSIISIALNAISIATGNIGGIVSIIISAIILYYLYRPHVKAYFGKAARTDATAAA
jgi:hypothetical protein